MTEARNVMGKVLSESEAKTHQFRTQLISRHKKESIKVSVVRSAGSDLTVPQHSLRSLVSGSSLHGSDPVGPGWGLRTCPSH